MLKAAVITLSDKGFQGEREDLSGPLMSRILKHAEIEVVEYTILPDDFTMLCDKLREIADAGKVNFIFTTGGTGLAPRDITPEATKAVIQKEVPGISEAMRMESLKHTPKAMLSRAIAGIRGNTLIINLPGSPKGVEECLNIILPVLSHAAELLTGQGGECARL